MLERIEWQFPCGTLPSYSSHAPVPATGGVPPGFHCAVQRFYFGVNAQASQFSPPVTLQPGAAVVQHSCAAVCQFSFQESVRPDEVFVQHSRV